MVLRPRFPSSLRQGLRLAALAGTLPALISVGLLPRADASTAAVQAVTPTSAQISELTQAFAQGRDIPGAAIGAVRPGSLHIADISATGADWAVASFLPADTASSQDSTRFQGGAAKGLFTRPAGGHWTLVPSQTQLACTPTIPASVKGVLGLSAPVACVSGGARPSAAVKAAAAKADDAPVGAAIANIALSQVGAATTPAETSFHGVDCDPYTTLVAAFSPNSGGCGPDAARRIENQNEAWCSDFAKWVWTQAGITTDMSDVDAGAVSLYNWALKNGQTPVSDSGTPAPGDAIVFFPPGPLTTKKFADHVGLITAAHADGTVDMVNGDFLGPDGITAQYDPNLSLTSWASTIWNAGEQWVIVKPPPGVQQPAPTASIVAPKTAAAGTAVTFSGVASQPGGSISRYFWTFDDGRDNNLDGQSVTHVFQRAGLYTVTLTATSTLGTLTTTTWNIGVSAPSSAVASAPDDSVWYTTSPLKQYEFTARTDGSLAVDSWDGANWLQQTAPGQLAAGSGLTSLSYADADAGYVTAPHAYYRSAGGSLGETYQGTKGWTSLQLPGAPAAASGIAALAVNPDSGGTPSLVAAPSVFFFDAFGALNVNTETNGQWSTATLPVPKTSNPGSLTASAAAGPSAAEEVFYLDRSGRLMAVTNADGQWVAGPVPNTLGVQPGSSLAAATTNQGTDLFFVDAAGKLAVAADLTAANLAGQGGSSRPAQEIAGASVPTGALTATNDLASGAPSDEVFYLTASGTPAVTARSGSAWQTTALPGTATGVVGASPNVIPRMANQLFVTDDGQLGVDTADSTGTTWTYTALPTTPTTYPGTVLLYAATPADAATAQAAASFAGLPAGQVTTDFARAWGATLSGNRLVIAVGAGAVAALYDNPCGWTNPSRQDPGSTPFKGLTQPQNAPLRDAFVLAQAADATQTPEAANDLAYYAVNGTLPSGATLPALAAPGHTCLGTAA